MTFKSECKLMKERIDNTMKEVTDEIATRAGNLLAMIDDDASLIKGIGGYMPILEGIRDKKINHQFKHEKFIKWMERELNQRQAVRS